MKLVVIERESACVVRPGLRRRGARGPAATGPPPSHARRLLRRLDVLHVDDELLDDAAALDGGILRGLDAIHLAAAQTLAAELSAVITYDGRMAAAAAVLGLPVAAPAPQETPLDSP